MVIIPVGKAQVGCVVTEAVGAAGILMVIVVLTGEEVMPLPSVTIKVYMVVAAGVATGLAIVVELKPAAGDQAYVMSGVPLLLTPDPNETLAAGQMLIPPPEIDAVGTRLEIPVKIIPVPLLVDPVVVSVFEPITPYLTQGKETENFAAAMPDSVPAISAAV